MPKTTLNDLRNHLFLTLEALGDPDKKMDPEQLKQQIERAKAISQVSGVIIETAKLELKAHELAGQEISGFFPLTESDRAERARRELKLLDSKQRNLA
jgi:hypothetical protein